MASLSRGQLRVEQRPVVKTVVRCWSIGEICVSGVPMSVRIPLVLVFLSFTLPLRADATEPKPFPGTPVRPSDVPTRD